MLCLIHAGKVSQLLIKDLLGLYFCHAGAISSAQAMVRYHGGKNICVETLASISGTDEPKRTTQNSTGFKAHTLRIFPPPQRLR